MPKYAILHIPSNKYISGYFGEKEGFLNSNWLIPRKSAWSFIRRKLPYLSADVLSDTPLILNSPNSMLVEVLMETCFHKAQLPFFVVVRLQEDKDA